MEDQRGDGTLQTITEDPLGKRHPRKHCPSLQADGRQSSDAAEGTASGGENLGRSTTETTLPPTADAKETEAADDKRRNRRREIRASGHVWGPGKPSKEVSEATSPGSERSVWESESSSPG